MSDRVHKHISKPDEVRRLEIFTGAGRRRRWTVAAKAAIVAESYGSDTTVSEVARRHGLTVAQLFAWRRAIGGAAKPSDLPLRFVPAVLDRGRPPPAVSPAFPPDGASVIVELAGAVVRIPPGASATTVATVLQALRSLP